MSTSEFDRQWEEENLDFLSFIRQESRLSELPEVSDLSDFSGLTDPTDPICPQNGIPGLPQDFSEEDIAFAHEMETMFSAENEEMPPYYVQTLLEADSPRFQPAEEGIEYKTKAHVFRRLRLHRRIFKRTRHSGFVLSMPRFSRPVLALMTACLLFMAFTMVATSSSFASGLAILLAGPHSGVVQMNGYPEQHLKRTHMFDSDFAVQAKQVDLSTAMQQLQFTLYQPSYVPKSYVLSDISMYSSSILDWSNGPIMEMDYSYTYPGSRHETTQISICEFKPNGQVYQVVQVGAAQYVQLGRDNSVRAVYVDGQWVHINKFSHNWVYGSRSEIIYEHDGVVFWIAGTDEVGVNQNTLLNIAASLQPLNARAVHMGAHINVTVADDSTNWPFANDVVYENGPNGSSLEVVGADLSSASSHSVTSSIQIQP